MLGAEGEIFCLNCVATLFELIDAQNHAKYAWVLFEKLLQINVTVLGALGSGL